MVMADKTELNISKATLRNWERLGVDKIEIENKLSKRANKLYSKKNIIPKEYFSHKKNIDIIKELLNTISTENISIDKTIYNLALNILCTKKFITIENNSIIVNKKYTHLKKILFKETFELNKNLLNLNLPTNEDDILGIIYQSLLKEGNKNKTGSYYTPKNIINKIKNKINKEILYLDCSCGTGSFLLTLSDKITNPKNLYGCDIDKIACFISKINLIIKFPNIDFKPNIYNENFLTTNIFNNMKFDLISTNLPWSSKANNNISNDYYKITKSKEIFSYFIIKSEQLLNKNGKCIFLLPESILNVKTHSNIRKFILENFSIKQIELLGRIFSSVLTNVILLELDKTKNNKLITIKHNSNNKYINQDFYKNNKNYNFSILDKKDAELLDKIYSIPHTTLKESIFGLGIVTGNNKKYIKPDIKDGEKIYTGKEITPYILKDTNNFIKYKKEHFQQTASDSIYRAKEKLVYKFISRKLVFAYDDKQRLFLNSANILIPNVKTHSVKTVLAFLNSNIFQYIYEKKFNELKILKGNLMQLPFPIIDNICKTRIETLTDKYILTGDNTYTDEIEQIISDIFQINIKKEKL